MYRFAENKLKEWKEEESPIPLLIRGARQIGKSFIVDKFGHENFKNFVTINFEEDPSAKSLFESLNPENILEAIYLKTKQKIETGNSLLFLDEVQLCPNAIKSLRFFHEKMPGLHVIGAGSLLDFLLKSGEISVPVGRVQYFFMQPLSFLEYLYAASEPQLVQYIQNYNIENEINTAIHEELLEHIKKYMLVGGMPKVLNKYFENNDIVKALEIQNSIINSYKDDFGKYAKLSHKNYLEKLFYRIPKQLSKKFRFVRIDSDLKSRDLNQALDLLISAGVMHKIKSTSGIGVPLEAEASEKDFKMLYLDIGLVQCILGLDEEIIESADFHSIAAGALAEQFVGQEILAEPNFYREKKLYYWEKSGRSDSAEVDYLLNIKGKVIPVEVKAGLTGKLRSLKSFMDKYKPALAVRISQKKPYLEDGILSLPFYLCSEVKRLVKSVS